MRQAYFCFIFVVIATLVRGQEKSAPVALEPGQVPEAVMRAFTADHPGENGAWSLHDQQYKVEFVQKEARVAHWIIYDKEGKVLKRDTEVESVPGDSHEPGNNLRPSAPDTMLNSPQRGPRSEALRYDSEGLPAKPENQPYTGENTGRRDER